MSGDRNHYNGRRGSGELRLFVECHITSLILLPESKVRAFALEDEKMDMEKIVEQIMENMAQDYLDASYGANRTINGLTFGGLDYLGDKFGFDSRMGEYLGLLSPEEQKLRQGLGNAIEWGGRALGLGAGLRGVNYLRAPYNSWQIGRAYDRLKNDPYQGSGKDVITRMKNHNGETVLLQRGEAIRGQNGEVVTSGKRLEKATGTERNYGLNKAIYKHDVSKPQAQSLPKYIRQTPIETSARNQDVYITMLPDGEMRIVTSPVNGQRTVATMYKIKK